MACDLLPGTFGKVVQGILGLMTMATLAFKWYKDKSGRTGKQFLLDSGKNCSGAASLHVSNLFFASLLAPIIQSGDACQWYWTEIVIDTTLGVYVEFFLLRKIIQMLNHFGLEELAHDLSAHASSAEHKEEGKPDQPLLHTEGSGSSTVSRTGSGSSETVNWANYVKQVLSWLAVVQLMKCTMTLIIMFEAHQLSLIAGFILGPLSDLPQLKLVVVMVFTPVVMNMFQFWLQDNIFVDAAWSAARKKQQQILEEAAKNRDAELMQTKEQLQRKESEARRKSEQARQYQQQLHDESRRSSDAAIEKEEMLEQLELEKAHAKQGEEEKRAWQQKLEEEQRHARQAEEEKAAWQQKHQQEQLHARLAEAQKAEWQQKHEQIRTQAEAEKAEVQGELARERSHSKQVEEDMRSVMSELEQLKKSSAMGPATSSMDLRGLERCLRELQQEQRQSMASVYEENARLRREVHENARLRQDYSTLVREHANLTVENNLLSRKEQHLRQSLREAHVREALMRQDCDRSFSRDVVFQLTNGCEREDSLYRKSKRGTQWP